MTECSDLMMNLNDASMLIRHWDCKTMMTVVKQWWPLVLEGKDDDETVTAIFSFNQSISNFYSGLSSCCHH